MKDKNRCPMCDGLGKRIAKYKGVHSTEQCSDCNGTGFITDNMLKFLKFCADKKAVEKLVNETTQIEDLAVK